MRRFKRSTTMAVVLACVAAGIVGVSGPAGAIVGGSVATRVYNGVASAQILFPGLGSALCGASLLSAEFVLVAAHCVSDQDAAPVAVAVPGKNVTIRVGSIDRTSGGQEASGEEVYLPSSWAWGANWPSQPVSDYALVRLAHPVQGPVTWLDTMRLPVGGSARLLGWGLTDYPPTTPPPNLLQQRDTTRLPNVACDGGFIGAGEVCLGGGACYGDSGSPALHLHLTGTGWSAVGIASRETSGDDPCGAPTVYTDTSDISVRLWIWTTIRTRHSPPCACSPAAVDAAARARIKVLRPTLIK